MLHGERITLRALTRDDLPALCAWSNDVEYELLGGGGPPQPHTLEGWQKWYDDGINKPGHESTDFGIELDGKLLGICGLIHFNETARHAELGIGIGKAEARGLGLGREAIQLLLHYAFQLRNLRRVYLSTLATNERALRCYRACGFLEEGRLREDAWSNGAYTDTVHMGILRREWAERNGK